MLSVGEIEQRLREQVEALARELLPAARREGNYLKVGSVQGEPGGSLVIELAGSGQGWWRDYAGTEAGDMLDLIRVTRGLPDKGAAVAYAKQFLGIEDSWGKDAKRVDPAEQARERAARAEEARLRNEKRMAEQAELRALKIRRARGLFLGPASVPIEGTPAEQYLLGRGLQQQPQPGARWPRSLRFNPEVWCSAERCKIPALLAMVVTAAGEHVATHRIYLMERGGRWTKIDSPDPKKMLGPNWGGFVPVSKGASGKPMAKIPEGEAVYATEGIEDALVLRMKKPEARIVCAVTLPALGAMVLPERVQSLVIIADRDDKPKAIDALEKAIAAHQARGLCVRLVMPPREVNGRRVKDLNDWLLAERAGVLRQAQDERKGAA